MTKGAARTTSESKHVIHYPTKSSGEGLADREKLVAQLSPTSRWESSDQKVGDGFDPEGVGPMSQSLKSHHFFANPDFGLNGILRLQEKHTFPFLSNAGFL
ncbi:hypothetical protein ASPCAL10258 [Aspergillus calidoustus]|uniref:Uncharacterized protein n=1 Tax=Aspergillus calidoustus TaxID=454130 RepID=A0A0U5G5X6_ASPCI|nr:hypothetical protein ASPCAL10258 [Aspergillus calidoustus]